MWSACLKNCFRFYAQLQAEPDTPMASSMIITIPIPPHLQIESSRPQTPSIPPPILIPPSPSLAEEGSPLNCGGAGFSSGEDAEIDWTTIDSDPCTLP